MDGLQNGPGISLFQGSDDLEINPGENANDEEEEEAIADQRRMDQELRNLLTNAFDDLIDDDDQSTINSSLNLGSFHREEDYNHHSSYADVSGEENVRHHNGSLGSGHYSGNHHSSYTDVSGVEDNARHHNRSHRSGHNSTNHHSSYTDYSGVEDDEGHRDESNRLGRYNSKASNRSQSPRAMKVLEEYMNRRNNDENRALAEDSGAGGDASVMRLHYQHCVRNSSGGQHDETSPNVYTNAEQLQVLYEVRVREIQRLTQQLEQYEQEKDQLLRKVALREAEKEHAQVLYKQAQSLLVEHKEKISELEKQVEGLKTTVALLEKSKAELTHQLEASQASVMDLHSRISLLERANFNQTDKHMDAFLRNVQASHSKELKKLENQLESTATKLSKKEYDLEQLQKHTEELTRKYEALMVEKAETINQLSRSLEESQRQCQQLMGSSVSEEVVRLRVLLETAVKEKEEALSQKQEFQNELEAVRRDVQQYDAIAKLGLFRPDESIDEADSIVQMGIGNRKRESGSGGIPHLADLNAKLRDELQRCLIGQKLKREEIARLKAKLTSREQSIAALQKQEAEYLIAVEKLKAEYVVLIEELNGHRELARKSMTQKQKDEKAESSMRKAIRAEFETGLAMAKEESLKQAQINEELQEEIYKLNKLLDEEKKETIDQYSEEYLKFHDQVVAKVKQERDREHEAIVAGLRYELEDARKEVDRVKEMYIQVCGSKEELVSTLQQERKASLELRSQLEKLEAEMRAISEAERARAVHHEASLIKLNSEKERLDKERRSLAEVQALQREHEEAMLKLQEERKRLEVERETLGDIHSLQQELEKEKTQHKAAMLKLSEERSKLEVERRDLAEIQTLQHLLEEEKAEHIVTLSKLEEEKEKLKVVQTLQQQIEELKTQHEANLSKLSSEQAKVNALQNELKAKTTMLEELKVQHENQLKNMEREHTTALAQMEEKAKHLYTIRVTEEIEKAKLQALAELEQDWARRREEKEANRQDTSTSPIKNSGIGDVDRIRKELTAAFHGQVTELQLKHQAALEQTSERVKDETVRFFAEQIRQLDAKHRVDLQRVEKVHKDTVTSLRKTLVEEHAKFLVVTRELQRIQQSLKEERNQEVWKKKAEELSQKLLEAEKSLETYRSKYRAAKKTTWKYKEYIDAKEKHLNSEWQRINSGFQQTLEKVLSRLESLLESKGLLSEAKLIRSSEQIKELQSSIDKNDGNEISSLRLLSDLAGIMASSQSQLNLLSMAKDLVLAQDKATE